MANNDDPANRVFSMFSCRAGVVGERPRRLVAAIDELAHAMLPLCDEAGADRRDGGDGRPVASTAGDFAEFAVFRATSTFGLFLLWAVLIFAALRVPRAARVQAAGVLKTFPICLSPPLSRRISQDPRRRSTLRRQSVPKISSFVMPDGVLVQPRRLR